MNKSKLILPIFSFLLLFLFSQCSKNDSENNKNPEWVNCTIKDMTFIDSCNDYMIVIEYDDPVHNIYYKPDKLSDNFKVDNLSVKVKYIITEKTHNCGFGGDVPIISIIKIEKR